MIAHTAQPQDRLRLIHADLLENITDKDGKAIQFLTGNVKFQKGATIITCQSALYRNRDGVGSFTNNVRMEKEEQTLIADSLNLDSNNDVVAAHGSVHFNDSEYHLKSERLTFYTEMDSGIAEGDVKFFQKGQTITAEKIIYKKESSNVASYRAEGNVIIQEEQRTATCGISIYDAVSDLSHLLDDPLVVQEGQQLSGEEIYLRYRDDKLFRLSIP